MCMSCVVCRYLLKPSVLCNALTKPFNIFQKQFENIVPMKITVKVSNSVCVCVPEVCTYYN